MPRVQTPTRRATLRAEVTRAVRTSPSFVTLTVSSPELADFDAMGFDQCVRLFFRRDGQQELNLPTATGNGWMAQYMLMRPSRRPWVRNWTVRAFRPDEQEIDFEFALHGDIGPASAFAPRARPGEPVGLFTEGMLYLPTPNATWQLLVADASGVPAALAILDSAPPDLRAQVYLEVPSSDDIRVLDIPASVTVHWLPRDGRYELPGRLALETVTSNELPPGPFYTWVAGESSLATGLRRFLVKERGVPKSDVTFLGYWRHGKASPG